MDRRQIERGLRNLGRRYWEYEYELSKIRVYKEVPGLGTIGCDQWWRLYWDPECQVSDVEMETLLLHELGHLNGEDAERAYELAGGRSIVLDLIGMHKQQEKEPVHAGIWNVCCDARINAPIRKLKWTKFPLAMTKGQKEVVKEIKKSGAAVPADGGVYPETLDPQWHEDVNGIQPPEWYYVQLRAKARKMLEEAGAGQKGQGQPQPGGKGAGGGGGGKGGKPQPGDGQGQGGGGDEQQDDGSGGGQGDQQKDGADGTCGSIATGQHAWYEDAPDEDCMSPDERQAAIEETERRIAKGVQSGKTKDGSGIGNEALFPMLVDPNKVTAKVNHAEWIAKMQQLIYQHLEHARRTWEHPHRRIDGLPGRKRFPKQAVVVCDISGSINELSVKRAFECLDRLWGRGFDLRVIVCDTKAHLVTDRKARYSGGGTDMGAGLKMAANKFPNADLVMVVTDGETPWPDQKPNRGAVAVLSWGREGPEWATNVAMPGLDDTNLHRPNW